MIHNLRLWLVLIPGKSHRRDLKYGDKTANARYRRQSRHKDCTDQGECPNFQVGCIWEQTLIRTYIMPAVSLFTVVSVGACVGTAPQNEPADLTEASCVSDRDAILLLDMEQFDRTPGSGWRPIAEVDGCETAAADLIAEYRETRINVDDTRSASSLAWHEGQLRAAADQTEQALNLFSKTFREKIDNNADVAWNLYVSATMAFLNRDRPALDAAHEELRNLPEPDFWAEASERTREKYGFTPVWPSNLNVVEKFQNCFGASYQEAYSGCPEELGEQSE